jgi:hypothetical protein
MMIPVFTGIKDIDFKILMYLDDESLITLGTIQNKHIQRLLASEVFWENFFKKVHKNKQNPCNFQKCLEKKHNQTWKEFYMWHKQRPTIHIPKTDLSLINEEHHQISNYCRQWLTTSKSGNITVLEQSTFDEKQPNIFQMKTFDVIDESEFVEHLTQYNRSTAMNHIGFAHWDAEVENLDNSEDLSDAAMCFGMSQKLRWNDVMLTPYTYYAPNIERLREAFSHVYLCAWCPLDI